jgi:hypothetical protein
LTAAGPVGKAAGLSKPLWTRLPIADLVHSAALDTIINGHITTGPTPSTDLQVYADFNKDFLTYVQDSIMAGKTLDQATADCKFPEKYVPLGYNPPAAGGGRGGPGNNIRTAYVELEAEC